MHVQLHWSTVATTNVFIRWRRRRRRRRPSRRKKLAGPKEDLGPKPVSSLSLDGLRPVPANDQCIYAALLISYPRPDSHATDEGSCDLPSGATALTGAIKRRSEFGGGRVLNARGVASKLGGSR